MEMQILSAVDQHANYFKRFVKSLVDKFQPLQIFCFSKTGLLAENTGCFKDYRIDHQCNYCLLMVTNSNTRIEHEVQEFSNTHYKRGTVSILCHGKESISASIKANSRFYLSVYTKGQLLYSHDGMNPLDFSKVFIPTQAANKARKHFARCIPLAEGFLDGAVECLAKDNFNVATFMLHQVVEQCCIVLLRVHLAYRSEVHNLQRMLRLCCSFSDRPIKSFLSGSLEDERLFGILTKSYLGSRYGEGFSVSQRDAQRLYERTSFFVTLVKEMCDAKIEELENQVILYHELKKMPLCQTN